VAAHIPIGEGANRETSHKREQPSLSFINQTFSQFICKHTEQGRAPGQQRAPQWTLSLSYSSLLVFPHTKRLRLAIRFNHCHTRHLSVAFLLSTMSRPFIYQINCLQNIQKRRWEVWWLKLITSDLYGAEEGEGGGNVPEGTT